MTVLIAVLVAVALGAWLVAISSAISIVSLSPRGSRMAHYFDLGYWRFGRILASLGPPAQAPIKRYRIAFGVFFCAVLAIALAAMLAAS